MAPALGPVPARSGPASLRGEPGLVRAGGAPRLCLATARNPGPSQRKDTREKTTPLDTAPWSRVRNWKLEAMGEPSPQLAPTLAKSVRDVFAVTPL